MLLESNVYSRSIADIQRCRDTPSIMAKQEYQCCYCNGNIAQTDIDAVRIAVSGLWVEADGASQELFAHRGCAAEKFGGALSPLVPFDIEAFAPGS